jgi:hypothetical protein
MKEGNDKSFHNIWKSVSMNTKYTFKKVNGKLEYRSALNAGAQRAAIARYGYRKIYLRQ